MVESSVSMALSDFYAINSHYTKRLSLSFRDSHGDPLVALSSALDLLQNVGVGAIIGGSSLLEIKLLAEIGEKFRVPVISLNSPISSLLGKYSHFVQATHDSASEAKGITAFIHGFDWNSVALVYEDDDDDWRESMRFIVDHFHENGVLVRSKVGFTVSSSEEIVMDQLQKLKDLGVEETVYVVHLSQRIATHLFTCAGRLGMMGEGFVWILTAKSINSFHENTDDFVKEAMEGVVGFKSYIPMSKKLHDFTWRWRKSLPVEENVGLAEMTRLSISGVWAHDIACALARAAEVVASMSNVSSTLLEAITETSFKGLSGDFQLVDKKLLSNKFEIVNMVGSGERGVGFWNSNGSFSNRRHLSSTHNELDTIIWPGGSAQSPKWRNEREGKSKKLRVLVTSSNRFPRLMKVETNPETNRTKAEGFCIEVFLASIAHFNYEVEYIRWLNGSDYDNLAYALYTQVLHICVECVETEPIPLKFPQKDKYDAAVGVTTITPNRMKYADFTIPFTEMGLGIVAPKETSMWVFFRPLTPDLWITSAAFFALTGIIVWLIERSENTEFQGSWSQQIGVMLWYGFYTLVYAHRERLKHNLSRFLVTVWVFAVLILTTSYNATLTSIMTVQEIRLNSNKDYVGHLSGSLIASAVLTNFSLRVERYKGLNTSKIYAEALLNKTVSYVVDEIPYLKVLLGEYPAHVGMVKTQCTTNGFGFMFQKGHELVSHVSREISILRTSERLNEMEKRWFNKQFPYATGDTADPKSLYMFRGLFMVTGVSFAFAITVLVRDKWKVLVNSVKIRLRHFKILLAETFLSNRIV